jgi:PepSY-associated TM region
VHKWLALIVGVQALIWTLSGLYMTVVHIDIIHGDHFIRHAEPRPVSAAEIVSPVAAAAVVSDAETVRLSWLLDRPVYIVRAKSGERLVDAFGGQPLPPPPRDQIQQLAEHWFTGPERLAKLELVTDLPSEVRGRKPPLWRAEFDGWNKPTLYLSPETGQLLTRRHELWRIFDFLWMLHIMDYETRDNVNNWLLRGFTLLAFTTVLSGAWLLWFAFPRKRRKAASR